MSHTNYEHAGWMEYKNFYGRFMQGLLYSPDY